MPGDPTPCFCSWPVTESLEVMDGLISMCLQSWTCGPPAQEPGSSHYWCWTVLPGAEQGSKDGPCDLWKVPVVQNMHRRARLRVRDGQDDLCDCGAGQGPRVGGAVLFLQSSSQVGGFVCQLQTLDTFPLADHYFYGLCWWKTFNKFGNSGLTDQKVQPPWAHCSFGQSSWS